MASFSSKILNIATGALSVHQAGIAVTAQNISNVNTPGYARRQEELRTKQATNSGGSLVVGNGVELEAITRVVDKYKDELLRTNTGEKTLAETKIDYLDRAEALFPLNEGSIGQDINNFFTALNDLTTNPSSIALRSVVIQKAQIMVDNIKSTYNSIASLQTEIDRNLESEVTAVNALTTQIASLNGKIAAVEGTGTQALDERDERERLLSKLSEKLSFTTREDSDGQITVSLSTGLGLVSGSTSRNLATTKSPSFDSSPPPGLEGAALNYVVFDYGSGSQIDLTSILASESGTIAADLTMRGVQSTADTSAFQATGLLPELATRVEWITQNFLTTFNTTYLGNDEDSGTVGHQPSSRDLDGNAPSVYGFFTFNYSGAHDVDGDGLPNDLTNSSLGIDNFSSIFELTSTDPRGIAAALDTDSTAGSVAYTTGDGSNAEALAALQDTNMSLTIGSYTATNTFEGQYRDIVTYIGNEVARGKSEASVAQAKYTTALNQRDAVSGVNLDEEFTDLIRKQKAFQASAKMVGTATQLLDDILRLI